MTIGVLTHDASFTAWLRDLLCFELAWFALWKLPLPARWLLGVTLAVAVRALFVGHFAVDFFGVALAFVALFVLLGRALTRRSSAARPRPQAAPSADGTEADPEVP